MTLVGDARAVVVEQVANLGQTVTDEVLDAVFLDVSEGELLAAADVRVRWEWWDGQAPINGVPADQVRERFTIPGRAYLIHVDDRLVYFQPHAPEVPGVAALDSASDVVVNTIVASLVYGLARDALVAEVMTALGQLAVQQQEREAVAEAQAAEEVVADRHAASEPRIFGRRRASAKGF